MFNDHNFFIHYNTKTRYTIFDLAVGYDITFNQYTWYRAPKLHDNIILDNHDVAIEAYNDTYISEGIAY